MPDEIRWYESFWTYLEFTWQDLVGLALDHAVVVIISVVLSTLIGVGLGVATYRTQRPRELVLAITGTLLTIPSLALFTLLIQLPLLGLGAPSVVVALTLYGLLPIVRNTIVGLRGVDPAVVESAQGMGMSRTRRLWAIELPLAWPVVLTGVRVSTLLLIGIAAIGAYINGPGLGDEIFSGLARIGSASALNQVLAGTLGVIVLAILFDLVYVVITRLTTSKGIR
ncbi:ABC transporter permease [Nocardioides sp. InS609-2]|uniref:ABC transporter permease n=1 Tax=Nocardioides sp. InS609-2 TaxID=2760705 RepID=UPI0020BE930B|nr:ABC transporter permease [Nocardioides sp. InS609-2]